MCFPPSLGIWCGGGGGGPMRLVHNLLMHFSSLYSSKIEVSETYFFDVVITSNDHPRYVKHVLARIYVVFTLFWVCVAWGRFSARWTCRSIMRSIPPKGIRGSTQHNALRMLGTGHQEHGPL